MTSKASTCNWKIFFPRNRLLVVILSQYQAIVVIHPCNSHLQVRKRQLSVIILLVLQSKKYSRCNIYRAGLRATPSYKNYIHNKIFWDTWTLLSLIETMMKLTSYLCQYLTTKTPSQRTMNSSKKRLICSLRKKNSRNVIVSKKLEKEIKLTTRVTNQAKRIWLMTSSITCIC